MADSNIHAAIVSSVNNDIQSARKDVELIENQMIRDFTDGKIMTGRTIFEAHVRDMRKAAIKHYEGVKLKLMIYISEALNEVVEVPPLEKMRNQYSEMQDIKKRKRIAAQRGQQIADELELTDYKKYQLYRYTDRWNQNAGRECSRRVVDIVNKANGVYNSEKIRNLIIGIIVTIICTMADFSILYSFFQSSNLTVRASVITAAIVAAVLDAPPYVLGILWTRRDDQRQLGQMSDPEAAEEYFDRARRYNSLMHWSVATFFFICVGYITVRIITFLGGGDFSIALHAFLQWDFQFQDVYFSSSDLLTILTPLGTSVVAFSVGMIMQSSQVDHISSVVTMIDQELTTQKRGCEEEMISCEAEIEKLKMAMEITQGQIWSYYMGQEVKPKEDEVFRNKIIKKFQEFSVPLYRQTYEICANNIKNEAEFELGQINRGMAVYADSQIAIVSMSVSKEERELLDNIWVTENGRQQNDCTRKDIEQIENRIKTVIDRLKASMDYEQGDGVE